MRHFEPYQSLKVNSWKNPWITGGIQKAIKIKNELLFSGDRERWKLYRNKVHPLSCISKKNYYYSYFKRNINNIKKTWEGINVLINRKRKAGIQITRLKR